MGFGILVPTDIDDDDARVANELLVLPTGDDNVELCGDSGQMMQVLISYGDWTLGMELRSTNVVGAVAVIDVIVDVDGDGVVAVVMVNI